MSEFLDDVVQVGNGGWATHPPQTDENVAVTETEQATDLRGKAELPEPVVSAGDD